jgi:alpha-beta hydrolase superfamily lysophospholipase
VLPFVIANQITHAPRWAIDESAVGIAHREIRIVMRDGRRLSAWYVPSRNGAAVLLSHGSGGSRGRVASHVRMLARHGYGVLALDNPGNGESEGTPTASATTRSRPSRRASITSRGGPM